MSFAELNEIAKANHETGAHGADTLKMNSNLRAVLREKYPPRTPAMGSGTFVEAFEMSAAKHGMPFMGHLGELTGIRIWVDDSMPDNAWKLVDPQGNTIKEGVVSEGN